MRLVVLILLAASALPAADPGAPCRNLDKHGKREQAQACFRKLTQLPSPEARAEGFWGVGSFDQANQEFRAAVAMQPKDADLRVRWGRLFLERFNPADAKQLFQEALEIDPENAQAWLALALAGAQSFESKAVEAAGTALKHDPNLVEAQELLARLALEDNDPEKAAVEADKALKMAPDALDAMAVHASIDLLRNKEQTPWFGRIGEVNPNWGRGYALAAHILVLNRRYEEGIALYRRALEADPDLHQARSEMGINLMRLGREKEAREALEHAYNAGYQSYATVNSLRLMDSYSRFETFTTPNTIVRLHKKEAELLRPYFEDELKRAIAIYEKKYGFKLDAPVQVEVYPDHEDFAVRTLGMPGLGALGVTFGNVVAMDSPTGRKPGSFHWASTLWHELSHVFVLSATKHRVPRWFTEGMAVHEETAAAPDWGDRLDPQVIRAIKEKKLLPIADLDRGFVRPSYPNQVIVSYFQAGRICDYINEKWGYSKLLGMMKEFGESRSTPDVIRSVLGLEPEQFDKQFLAWLDKDVQKTVAGYEQWQKHMKALAEAVKADNLGDAEREAKAAIAIYPDYVESGNAYEMLAQAAEKKGDKTLARQYLEQYSKAGGRSPATLTRLSEIQAQAGAKAEAIRTLERLLFVYPVGDEMHRTLGEMYLEAGNHKGAVREFAAAVASNPPDQAGARFNLARALNSAARREEAKEQLLLALEIAPGFKPAQRLLLELSSQSND